MSNRQMQSPKPLVSIGVPTFNRPEGLRRTLECLTRQTYPTFEIIISDNATPGNGPERVS
jgi:Glycosyltransferases involved in cell wall biogenesis